MGVRLRRAQIAQGWQRDRILCHPGAVLHVPLCSLCSSVTQSSLVSRWRKKMAQCAHSILSSFSSSPPKPYSEFRRMRTLRASKCELRGRAWKPEGLTDQTLDRCLIGASAANGGRTRARRARSRRSGTLQLKAKRATLAVPPSSPLEPCLEHGRQKAEGPAPATPRRSPSVGVPGPSAPTRAGSVT